MNTEPIIEWLQEALNYPNYQGYTDLHIDDIFEVSLSKKEWVEKGFLAFKKAIELKAILNDADAILMLRIFLKETKNPRGVVFGEISQMKKELSITPPSLNIYKKGEDYDEFISKIKNATITYNGLKIEGYLSQHYREDGQVYFGFLYVGERNIP